jgi:GNAT superfamily N-acetyltransferase
MSPEHPEHKGHQKTRAEVLFRCVALKFAAEGQADSLIPDLGPHCQVLRYRVPRRWPGPPAFDFSIEILSSREELPESVGALIRSSPEEAVVIRTFQEEAPHDSEGTEVAFIPILWRRVPPVGTPPVGHETRAGIHAIRVPSDLEVINRTHLGADTIRPGILDEPRIHAFWIESQGMAAASGMLVHPVTPVYGAEIAYISDMFTAPEFRRRGFGRALLDRLLVEAAELGVREVMLLPSALATKARFYERAGFKRGGGLRVNHFLPRALSSIFVVDFPST